MGKVYSNKEMEEILQKDVKIPEAVEERIQETYKQIEKRSRSTVPFKKQRNVWKAAAAVAVLVLGGSTVAVAANKLLSAYLVEKDEKTTYSVSVDRQIEAHAIEVEPEYMPEGYVYQEDGPFGGKWRNAEAKSNITIIPYNAAELDRMARLNEDMPFKSYSKDTAMEGTELDGQQVEVFVSDSFYVDSEDSVKDLYLFNEEYGYGIQLISESTLDAEEMVKIAKGLKVTVLDEIVPYATQAEIDEELKAREYTEEFDKELKQQYSQNVPEDILYEIGEEVPLYSADELTGELAQYHSDIRFTVRSVEVRDSISFDEFPAENFMAYDEVIPWINADGTLKPYERALMDENGNKKSVETVQSKFVVVKMNVRNADEVQKELADEIEITLHMTYMLSGEDGTYKLMQDSYLSANEGYGLQTDGFPIYIDKRYYTEGIEALKRPHIRPIAPGESLDYTLIYVVDEDMLDKMSLQHSFGNPEPWKSNYTIAGEASVK